MNSRLRESMLCVESFLNCAEGQVKSFVGDNDNTRWVPCFAGEEVNGLWSFV